MKESSVSFFSSDGLRSGDACKRKSKFVKIKKQFLLGSDLLLGNIESCGDLLEMFTDFLKKVALHGAKRYAQQVSYKVYCKRRITEH